MGIIERMRLDGKKALVTGGSRGLGKFMAYGLAEAGADVCIVNTNIETGKAVADEIAAAYGVKTMACQANVADPKQVDAMIEKVMNVFGDLDICIADAGITLNKPAEDVTYDEWQRVVGVNLTGVFLTDQAAGRVMIKNGKGSIINITSIRGYTASHPQPGCIYPATKAAVRMLTKSLAKEWGKYGVRVNAICPGYYRTELIDKLLDKIPEWEASSVLNRLGDPRELQSAVIYLACDASSFTTGAEIVVDGGFLTF